MQFIFDFFSNPENLNILGGVSSIGTFIAAFVALFTLRLLRKQIKNSQRPNITVGNSVMAECFSENNRILKTIWKEDIIIQEEKLNKPEKQDHSTLDYELINVGVGFAENVCMHEKFDTKAAIKFIQKIDIDNEFDFTIDNSNKHPMLFIKTAFDNDSEIIPLLEPKRELGNFKTATSSNNKESRFLFHDEYLAFISCFGYLRDKHNKFLTLEGFPTLKVALTFNDIDGVKYKNNFECSAFCISGDGYHLSFKKK